MAKDTRRQVNFRLTEEEAAKIARKAEIADLTISAYCKSVAINGRVKAPVIEREVGKALLPHLSKIGSNLNQLTKKAHSEGITLEMAAHLETLNNQMNALWEYILEGKKPELDDVLWKEPPAKPRCELCGAEMIAGSRKKDDSPIWYCPNFKDTAKGQHSIFDRKE